MAVKKKPDGIIPISKNTKYKETETKENQKRIRYFFFKSKKKLNTGKEIVIRTERQKEARQTATTYKKENQTEYN